MRGPVTVSPGNHARTLVVVMEVAVLGGGERGSGDGGGVNSIREECKASKAWEGKEVG